MVASHLPSRPPRLAISEDREFITEPLVELLAIQLYLVSLETATMRPWPGALVTPLPWVEAGRVWRDHFRAIARGTEPLT